MDEKYVVVTTEHRGVFFGFGPSEPDEQGRIRLRDARMCVYWSSDCKGVMGLAATGPTKSCRIGPAASSLLLTDVTSVAEASDVAQNAWNKAPWG